MREQDTQRLPCVGFFCVFLAETRKTPAGGNKKDVLLDCSTSFCYKVAAMTALMVCMRFSASSKTMEASLSKTSSVTSIQVMPNLS